MGILSQNDPDNPLAAPLKSKRSRIANQQLQNQLGNDNQLTQSTHMQSGEYYNVKIYNEQVYNTVSNDNMQINMHQNQIDAENNQRIGVNNNNIVINQVTLEENSKCYIKFITKIYYLGNAIQLEVIEEVENTEQNQSKKDPKNPDEKQKPEDIPGVQIVNSDDNVGITIKVEKSEEKDEINAQKKQETEKCTKNDDENKVENNDKSSKPQKNKENSNKADENSEDLEIAKEGKIESKNASKLKPIKIKESTVAKKIPEKSKKKGGKPSIKIVKVESKTINMVSKAEDKSEEKLENIQNKELSNEKTQEQVVVVEAPLEQSEERNPNENFINPPTTEGLFSITSKNDEANSQNQSINQSMDQLKERFSNPVNNVQNKGDSFDEMREYEEEIQDIVPIVMLEDKKNNMFLRNKKRMDDSKTDETPTNSEGNNQSADNLSENFVEFNQNLISPSPIYKDDNQPVFSFDQSNNYVSSYKRQGYGFESNVTEDLDSALNNYCEKNDIE